VLARAAAILTLVALAGLATPAADGPRSPRNANYVISAKLNPATRVIDGTERLSWTNTTSHPASSLQFHLYYNAWRDANSTWMRERMLSAAAGYADRQPDEWASIDITSLSLTTAGGAGSELKARLRFIAPDDGNPDDRTVVELPLDQPVDPGETIDVQIAWTSHVPRTFARTGAIGDYFFIAQWFPKIGVLEDSGWNCHQFHSSTEFFSDFGVYDVRLTIPNGWIVGATGVEVDSREESGGWQTHHFVQEDVHDFAWTTSPHYVVRTARFEQSGLPPVEMRLLLQPEHVGQAERHFAGARAALGYYGQWYGPYPYGHITIVDPAYQSGAGGMEYPTLFTAGTRWLVPAHATTPEGVTVHEAGHQFWYGIVATNEFENAWMDEGFNTFSEGRVLAEAFSPDDLVQRYFGGFIPWRFDDIPQPRVINGDRITGYRTAARQDIQATPTFRYWPPTSGAITYNKTALWLHTLENYLGWPMLQRIMSTYFQRHRFTHPKPDDFFAVANEVSGQDLRWYFIDRFRSTPAGGRYHAEVTARRYQDGVFPVTVRVTFANGTHKDWTWDGRGEWASFATDGDAEAVSAEVDPDRVLVLDVNRTNNSASLRPQAAAASRKWSLAWLVWLQDQLLTYGFFV
jgi:hypothetical protein